MIKKLCERSYLLYEQHTTQLAMRDAIPMKQAIARTQSCIQVASAFASVGAQRCT